jgi:hypothetical protein
MNPQSNDLDTMRRMLERAGIEYDDNYPVENARNPQAHTELVIWRGYSGFMSIMTFNVNGALIDIEAYE